MSETKITRVYKILMFQIMRGYKIEKIDLQILSPEYILTISLHFDSDFSYYFSCYSNKPSTCFFSPGCP